MALTKMQYDEIIRAYDRIRLENKRRQTERIAEIYERFPRIMAINEEISSMSLDTTKQLLEEGDGSTALHTFRKNLDTLKSERLSILKDNGYPADYMDIHYQCKDCKDTGYIENQKCHCFKKAEIEILYNQSNIRDILTYENFSHFKLDYFNDTEVDSATGKTPKENMTNVLNICKEFVQNFYDKDRKYSNLLFFGKTGVGKTYLTNCIAKELIEQTSSVIYLSAIKFFDILSDAEFDRDNEAAKNQSAQIFECNLLIIDDLGTELSNSFTNSALFNVMNERLLNRKSTIISTNLIFSELMERYSERLTSRMAKEYTFMKIYGEDLRHKRK